MSTIRGWVYYIVLAITLIPLAIALIILYPASVSLRYQLAVGWARFMLKMGEVICGMRYQFKGTGKLPHRRHICFGSLQAPIGLGYFCLGFL